MGWRVEAWTLPDDPEGFERIAIVPAQSGTSLFDPSDSVGAGTVRIPAVWPHFDRVLHADPTDPGSGAQALLAFFRPGVAVPDFEMRAERASRVVDDEGKVSWAVRGPSMRVALDDAVVEPRTPEDPPWIWAGDDLLPTPRGVDDLAAIRSTWTLALPGETYSVEPTGGDWTLTVDGNTTAAISESAGASTIKDRLEALPGVTEVAVVREDDVVTVEFVRPRQIPGTMTGSGATVTQTEAGFDDSTDPTFTLTVTTDTGSDTTEALAWNVSPGAIEGTPHDGGSGLQGLSNVSDVTVTGRGTGTDPWRIVFVRPSTATLAVTTAITYALDESQAGVPDPGPFTQSQRVDQRDGVEESNHGTYDDPPVEVVTDDVRSGSSWSLAVNATGQFGGSQIVINATPGQLMQVGVWVRVDVDTLMRLVVRDPWEGLVKATTPNEVLVPGGVWTRLEVPDVVVPPGVDRLIVRVAIVDTDPATWQPFLVDWEGSGVRLGLPAATAGDIALTLLDRVFQRGALAYLLPSFTATHDSANVEWDAEWSFRADPRELLGTHTFGDLVALGYEWHVTRRATPGPNGETHDLHLWNPGGRSPVTDGAAFVEGANVAVGGAVEVAAPTRTHLLVEADDGSTEWVTIPEFAGWARREDAGLFEWAPDAATAAAAGEVALRDDLNNLVAVQLRLTGQQEPYARFGVGSLVPVVVRGVGRHERRVSVIAATLGESGRWDVEVTCSRVFADGEGATAEAVFRLLSVIQRRRRQSRPPLQAPRQGGGGGMATLLVMPADHPQAGKADVQLGTITDWQTALDEVASTQSSRGVVWVDGGPPLDASQVLEVVNAELRGVSERSRIVRPVTGDGEFVHVGFNGVLRDVDLWRQSG